MTEFQSFESFMRSYQNMVYSKAYRLLANHAEAQDIAQDVFLKAYDRYDDIGGSPRVGGWLKTVTRNLGLNHLTRHRRRWRLFSDFKREGDDESDYEASLEDEQASIAGTDDSNDQRLLLEEAMEALPSDQRIAIA
jgi:RNA polymerase sigma-70 factor, ECF subfamily